MDEKLREERVAARKLQEEKLLEAITQMRASGADPGLCDRMLETKNRLDAAVAKASRDGASVVDKLEAKRAVYEAMRENLELTLASVDEVFKVASNSGQPLDAELSGFLTEFRGSIVGEQMPWLERIISRDITS